jgi:hypothetical protein
MMQTVAFLRAASAPLTFDQQQSFINSLRRHGRVTGGGGVQS